MWHRSPSGNSCSTISSQSSFRASRSPTFSMRGILWMRQKVWMMVKACTQDARTSIKSMLQRARHVDIGIDIRRVRTDLITKTWRLMKFIRKETTRVTVSMETLTRIFSHTSALFQKPSSAPTFTTRAVETRSSLTNPQHQAGHRAFSITQRQRRPNRTKHVRSKP